MKDQTLNTNIISRRFSLVIKHLIGCGTSGTFTQFAHTFDGFYNGSILENAAVSPFTGRSRKLTAYVYRYRYFTILRHKVTHIYRNTKSVKSCTKDGRDSAPSANKRL
ncbi:hypothetical protein GDO86_005210 [Hymenochirus boettgeri]|uniref:Uncharacterized protein n=1 Tax=Hymenochirus boettgeri TaxID=247094 RepID=A0A8T2J5L0_9PIPI|nr:hypothetical protein GDO86_005210 [Hymenochirus boettgeri]